MYKELSPGEEIIYQHKLPIDSNGVIKPNNEVTLILNYQYTDLFFKKRREKKSSWVMQGLNIPTELKRIS